MRGNLQKVMIGLVVVIVLAFIFFSGDSLVKLVDTIKQGTPFFIIAAVVAQLCKYLAQGRGFQACFNTVNGHISYRTGLSLVFGTFFMNTVAPSMNLAGTSLVMATATRNGMQAGKGTTAALLMQLSIDSGFVIIMLTTFGVLTFTVGLQPGWLARAGGRGARGRPRVRHRCGRAEAPAGAEGAASVREARRQDPREVQEAGH